MVEKVTEMLYYILQPTTMDVQMTDEQIHEMPDPVKKIMRASLSTDQNAAVLLASRLAQAAPGSLMQPMMEKNEKEEEEENEDENDDDKKGRLGREKVDRLRKKVRTVARLARMFKTLRQENETVIRLKGVCPGHKMSPGLLLSGKEAMSTELQRFSYSKSVDTINEKRPDDAPPP